MVSTLCSLTTGGLLENSSVVYFEVSVRSNFSVHAKTREQANFGRQNFSKIFSHPEKCPGHHLDCPGEDFYCPQDDRTVLMSSPDAYDKARKEKVASLSLNFTQHSLNI